MASLAAVQRRGVSRLLWALLSWRTLAVTVLVLAVAGGYVAYVGLDSERAEVAVLVRDLAAMTSTREALIQTRDGLVLERDSVVAERDRVSAERDSERSRAMQAEDQNGRLRTQLAELTTTAAALEEQLKAATVQARRLQEEASALRDRIQSVQGEARDQARAADAAAAAQKRSEQLAEAMAEVTKTSNDLSSTRSRMIDVLLDQITAERAGRTATARSLVNEYNTLVTTHNHQISAFNSALSKLRGLLA